MNLKGTGLRESECAIAFIESLKNPEGTDWAGRPVVLLEWEKDYIRKLLDTRRPDGGLQYEQSLLFLPKKQGKTTLIAGLALFFLFYRKHGQIKCLAQVKDQAALLYKFVSSMIRQSSWLSKRVKVYRAKKMIECRYSDSTLEVLSSDAVGANGMNCSILLFDEVCFSQNSDLWDAVLSGGIMREQLLAIGLSTAGFSTACWGYQFYEKAKAILANPEIDPTFLPVIYEAPPNPDWQNVQTYIDCSPTFREMKTDAVRRIEGMIASAKKDPSELRRILRYHLNQWIGADAATPWIALPKWDECAGGDAAALLGKPCYGGLDLASVSDMTALSLLFPPLEAGGLYALLLKYYMPADTLAEKERRDGGAQYTAWARAGLITATPGDWTDYEFIRRDMKEIADKYQLIGVAVDRAYNAAHICQRLMEDGHNVQPIGQGALTVAPAAREIENLTAKRQLQHFGNPVLRWNIQNCVAKMLDDAGNVKPSKAKSTGRIDGVYAALNAMAMEMAGRGKEGAANVFFF